MALAKNLFGEHAQCFLSAREFHLSDAKAGRLLLQNRADATESRDAPYFHRHGRAALGDAEHAGMAITDGKQAIGLLRAIFADKFRATAASMWGFNSKPRIRVPFTASEMSEVSAANKRAAKVGAFDGGRK